MKHNYETNIMVYSMFRKDCLMTFNNSCVTHEELDFVFLFFHIVL